MSGMEWGAKKSRVGGSIPSRAPFMGQIVEKLID